MNDVRRWSLAFLTTLLLLPGLGTVSAQTGDLYNIALTSQADQLRIETPGELRIPFTLYDLSLDSTATLLGDQGGNPQGIYHQTLFTIEQLQENTRGWSAQAPLPINSVGGQAIPAMVRVQTTKFVEELRYDFRLVATFQSPDGVRQANLTFSVFTFGQDSFTVQAGAPLLVGPDEIHRAEVRVRNNALLERGYDLEIVDNPCDLMVAVSQNNLVPPKTTRAIPFSFLTPNDRPYYLSEDCSLTIKVSANDNPESSHSTLVAIQVNGFYVDPVWIFWTVGILLALAAFLILVGRRKARIEEEILGKPQRPWTIPVEKVYLDHLKERDERAWYVVRHHLMEEEYASALMWYKNYKKATKASRKKERVILKLEHDYEKWKEAWQDRIARPMELADRYEQTLQRRLDARAEEAYRKALKKHRKRVKRLKAKHEKAFKKEHRVWEKLAARARKKGHAVPEEPVDTGPDLPDPPQRDHPVLADHPWQAKADDHRMRMEKAQGDLEVRFEKADAKKRRRLAKKLYKLARKLDDPDFVDEHPLLASSTE